MAFKEPESKVTDLVQYKKYLEYLKETYLDSIKRENGVTYQNYRVMTEEQKKQHLNEYAEREIKKLFDALATGNDLTINIIKSALLNSYNSDIKVVEKLMEEIKYVSEKSKVEQKASENNQKEVIPEDVLLSPAQKAYFLKEVEKYNKELPSKKAVIIKYVILVCLTFSFMMFTSSLVDGQTIIKTLERMLVIVGIAMINGVAFIIPLFQKLVSLTGETKNIEMYKTILERFGGNAVNTNSEPDNETGGPKR